MNNKVVLFLLIALLIVQNSACQVREQSLQIRLETNLVGRYTDGYTNILDLKEEYNKLFIEPYFQRGIHVVDLSNPNAVVFTEIFSGVTEPLSYTKDTTGSIISIRWKGKDLFKKKSDILTPIEQLVSVDREAGIKEYLEKRSELNLELLFNSGIFVLDSMPSKVKMAAAFFEILVRLQPERADGFYNLGRAYMSLQKKDLAKEAFQKSMELGFMNKESILNYLSIINHEKENVSHPQIDFEKLFEVPTDSEIDSIKNSWPKHLHPENISIELDTQFSENGFDGRLKVLSYYHKGAKNYGAIYIPNGAESYSLPAIVEAKGIDWQYTGLELSYRPKLAGYLGEYSNKFIYIIPSVRGETMTFLNFEFKSDQLPNNGWVGATEDYLSFFNVAYDYLGDQLDRSKIIAFGDSRGGTVAMLAAIRDNRLNTVINWAGPIDWLNHMGGLDGISLKEQVVDGLNQQILPQSGTPGQFIDWYFYKGANINQDLIRYNIIASSPLYFLDILPNNFMMHYGKEDLQVPIQNGYKLAEELKKIKKEDSNYKFFFHENIGHNLNPYEAVWETKNFILEICYE